jgi:ABC-type spermidine/putrescine transport system permease subunit I
LFASLLDSRLVKAKGIWKALLYIPSLTSVVISGTLFRMMFSERDGSQFNLILNFFGHDKIQWLKMYPTAYFALLLIACWRWTGVNMLYFLSGLKSIDTGLYESAEIDGATGWQKFIYVTIPMLRPTLIYVLTISIYAGLAMFLESFMLWGNGSPYNIGTTIVGYLYRRGIEKNQMGYASAVGLVLLIIALVINMIQLILSGTFNEKKTITFKYLEQDFQIYIININYDNCYEESDKINFEIKLDLPNEISTFEYTLYSINNNNENNTCENNKCILNYTNSPYKINITINNEENEIGEVKLYNKEQVDTFDNLELKKENNQNLIFSFQNDFEYDETKHFFSLIQNNYLITSQSCNQNEEKKINCIFNLKESN